MGDEDEVGDPDALSLSREFTIGSTRPLARISEASPDVIESQYNVDPRESVAREYVSPDAVDDPGQAAFVGLDPDERDECHDSLALQASDRAVERVLSLLERWKESSDPANPEPQTLERLYRRTFGLDTSVRARPDDGDRPPAERRPPAGPFAPETKAVVESLYHLTQALIRVQNDGRMTLYRGVRRRTAAELFAQTLDDPDREYFKIDADTVLNTTPSKAPAVDIGSNVVFRFTLPKEDVMLAVDQLRTGAVPYSDEYHVRGGKVLLQQGSVIYAPRDSDMWVPLRELLVDATSPGRQTERIHDQVYRLVKLAHDKGVHPGTEAGRDRLEQWVEILRQNALYGQPQRRLAERRVMAISDPDPASAHWL